MNKVYFITATLLLLATHSEAEYNKFKVIIIGAGASGIAAASRLLENHVQDLIILEAEDRYGGRINTVNFGNCFVELGAEWCHGAEGNIVYDMMKKYKLIKDRNYTYGYLYSDGGPIDEDVLDEVGEFMERLHELIDVAENKSESFGEFFVKHYDKHILEKFKDDGRKLKIAVETISSVEGDIMTEVGAFSLLEKSIGSHYKRASGSQSLTWDGVGYNTILEVMMHTFRRHRDILGLKRRIYYNQTVVKIEWQNEFREGITIWCANGDIYAADHVIFTPSLGVLKATYREMFMPPIPENKRRAIESLGFGGVMKMIVNFPSKWWESELFWDILVWKSEDKTNLPVKFPEGPIKDGESWISRVTTVHSAENSPNALVAWITGDIIPQVEETNSEIVLRGLMYVFNTFYGGEHNITEADSVITSSWCTNPNFRGTYSFESVDAMKLEFNSNEVLSEPLRDSGGVPIVLFAGEATSSKHYSTVHGAIESGYREADRLLKIFKTKYILRV